MNENPVYYLVLAIEYVFLAIVIWNGANDMRKLPYEKEDLQKTERRRTRLVSVIFFILAVTYFARTCYLIILGGVGE
jgi:arginine exporter protein ArgO